MKGLNGPAIAASVVFLLLLVLAFNGAFSNLFLVEQLGGTDGIGKVPAAEFVSTSIPNGCQSLPRTWALFVMNPTADQLERGIDYERSFSELYVLGVEAKKTRGSLGQVAFETIDGTPGLLILPHTFGNSMFGGLTVSGGNPNEAMTCVARYEVHFKPADAAEDVQQEICGNGACEAGESTETCPSDCEAPIIEVDMPEDGLSPAVIVVGLALLLVALYFIDKRVR